MGVLLTSLFICSIVYAKAFDLAGTDWEGLSDFVELARGELTDARVVVTGTIDFRVLAPEDALLLFHPESSLDVDSMAAFMRSGGRVALLDDFGTGSELLEHFKLTRVPMPDRPVESLRNNRELAIAEPVAAHPLTNDVSRVVTNHATGLAHPDLSPVLAVHAVAGPDVLIAVAGMVGHGRLLAVGDPSILINNMLRYPGNRQFGKNLVHYAVDDDAWGKRGGKLYILSNAFAEEGGNGGGIFGEATQAKLRAAKEALLDMRQNGMPPEAAYAGAVLAGLGLILWIGARAGRTHKSKSPRFVRPTAMVAQGGLAGHAAVVSAPRTSRVLAMLELKSALEEELCVLLSLEKVPGPELLVQTMAAKRLLDEGELTELKRLLLRLTTIETMVLSERAGAMRPVADKEVVDTAKVVQRLLSVARTSAQMMETQA